MDASFTRTFIRIAVMAVVFAGRLPLATAQGADWSTFRGNLQRTGNIDGVAGPSAPKVLWHLASTEQFLAAPAISGNTVMVTGIGALNTTRLMRLNADPIAPQRVHWEKSNPYLKLAVVSSPSTAGGLLVFGDGLHVDSGATLHGLSAESGLPLWQFTKSGALVHIEGSPALEAGRVYFGAGSGGVFCLDPGKLKLEGQPVEATAVAAELEKRWQALLAKFEDEKKKNPDFAVKPTEASLPRAEPAVVWNQGEMRLHVDASVAVTGDRVIAASAHLETEKLGERALVCLNKNDGAVLWTAPLRLNPMGGVAIAGDLAIVACSSIRFDPQTLAGAKGEIVAVSLADGVEKWKSNLLGGALGGVAIHNGLAICTASDGKVRAFDAATGSKKWIYDAKTPFFAGVAVVGDVAYTADLRGVVHAIGLGDGRAKWTFDLAADPVKSTGMVFGSPVIHGGRVYVATCHVDSAGKPTAVVCIGDK